MVKRSVGKNLPKAEAERIESTAGLSLVVELQFDKGAVNVSSVSLRARLPSPRIRDRAQRVSKPKSGYMYNVGVHVNMLQL